MLLAIKVLAEWNVNLQSVVNHISSLERVIKSATKDAEHDYADVNSTIDEYLIEELGFLAANCYEFAQGDVALAAILWSKIELAYRISGFGECIIIKGLELDWTLEQLKFHLDLATDYQVAELRANRKALKNNTRGKNIFGRRCMILNSSKSKVRRNQKRKY